MHLLNGIQTRNPSNRSAVDPSLRNRIILQKKKNIDGPLYRLRAGVELDLSD